MKTTAELKVALRNAHEAGDVEAAKRIAAIMKEQKENVALEQLETGLQEEAQQQRREALKEYPKGFVSGGLRSATTLLEVPEMITRGAESQLQKRATKAFPEQEAGITRYFDALGKMRKYLPGSSVENLSLLAQGLRQQPQTKELIEFQPESRGARYAQAAGEFVFPTMGFGLKRALAVGAPTGAVAERLEEAEASPYLSTISLKSEKIVGFQ